MAVHVDVCEARVTCFDNRCGRFALLAIEGLGYCCDHTDDRLGVHRRRGTEITWTDEARQLVDRAGQRRFGEVRS